MKKRRGRPRKVLITSEQLPTTGHNEEVELELVGDDEFCCVINKPKIQVAEIVTNTKCVLADRRCTSLRQQADQLTPENFENPGTSKSSIHRKREKYRIESLKLAQLKHITMMLGSYAMTEKLLVALTDTCLSVNVLNKKKCQHRCKLSHFKKKRPLLQLQCSIP